MNKLMKLYKEVFIPAWKESHTEEEPCFEEWKNNYFYEWLEEYINNKEYEWQAMLISSYAQDTITNIPICYDMCTLNDYDFTDIYNEIDHENFNVRHDVYWENICGYIRSGDYCDYVDEYWDDNKDDILRHIINCSDTFMKDIDLDEYEY